MYMYMYMYTYIHICGCSTSVATCQRRVSFHCSVKLCPLLPPWHHRCMC